METTQQHTGPRTGKLPGPGSVRGLKALRYFEHDLPYRARESLLKKRELSIDTETDGLDFREHQLRLVQICTPEGRVYIVRNPDLKSQNLRRVLDCNFPYELHRKKIFHHAAFDLRFIKAYLDIEIPIEEVQCTKLMMKISQPQHRSGIGVAMRTQLGIILPKFTVDYSKWNIPRLTDDQLLYSAADVIYLQKLFQKLRKGMSQDNRNKYRRALDVIVPKTYLEVEGYTDLFDYPQNAYKLNLEQRNWWLSRQQTGD